MAMLNNQMVLILRAFRYPPFSDTPIIQSTARLPWKFIRRSQRQKAWRKQIHGWTIHHQRLSCCCWIGGCDTKLNYHTCVFKLSKRQVLILLIQVNIIKLNYQSTDCADMLALWWYFAVCLVTAGESPGSPSWPRYRRGHQAVHIAQSYTPSYGWYTPRYSRITR